MQPAVREMTVESLVHDARFGSAEQQRAARSEIRRQAAAQGIRLASIEPLYRARGRGLVSGFTVPAINVRGLSFDFIRAIIRAALHDDVGAFIIEIARSEIEYTDQRPDELAAVALAAAIAEGYTGPLFLQGDHYKVNPKRGVDREVQALEQLIAESLAAGFYNIDIDASPTVDLSRTALEEQQAQNGSITAHLTAVIRRQEPVSVSVGGEIGEIGGLVSTVGDLRAFMAVYRSALGDANGITKVAVQTGTSHGGVSNPDGTMKRVAPDFRALEQLSRIAREEFALAGAVQHGASTLSLDFFKRFPEIGTAEIHLSTEFQNVILEHPAFPRELRKEVDAFIAEHFASERMPNQTDAQFRYKTRKHLWGPFKKAFAQLPADVRSAIGRTLEDKVSRLFRDLGVVHSRSTVDQCLTGG